MNKILRRNGFIIIALAPLIGLLVFCFLNGPELLMISINFVEIIGVRKALILSLSIFILMIIISYVMIKFERGDYEKSIPSNRILKKAFKEVGFNQPFTVDQNGKVTKCTHEKN